MCVSGSNYVMQAKHIQTRLAESAGMLQRYGNSSL